MRIICPECGFSRDVPDAKVPAATSVATCPKCRHRFRFRHLDDGFEPSAADRESSPSGSRPAREGEGGYRPRADLGTAPRFPSSPRPAREHDAPAAADSPAPAPPDSRTGSEPPGERGRGFPPPSAHWEPAAPVQDASPGPEPVMPPRAAPHAAAMDAPPQPEHEDQRLRVDERAAVAPRPEPRPEAEQEHNGVRDIWARLQAMDDEDVPRQPPRSAPPPAGDPQRAAPGKGHAASAERDAGRGPEESVREARPEAHDPLPREASDAARPAVSPAPDEGADAPSAPDPDAGGKAGDDPGMAGEQAWERAGEPVRGEVPWERPDAYGFFSGLVLTLKGILFQPVDFFESMPLGRGKGKALVFNLLLSEFLLLVDFLWAILGVRAKIADTGQTDALAAMAGVPGVGFLILLVMVPVFMAAGIFLDAGLTHLLLRLLRGASRKFDETFRVMCYSAAPTVLSAVPVAGQLLSPVILIWYMTLQAIGLKKVHGAAYSQALAVVLIKWSLYLFLLLGMLHGLPSGG